MIRIAALNEDAEDESDSDKEEVTREALEEIAFQQYAKTLELQRKGNHEDALALLKALLDTELLYRVERPPEKDNITRPLLNLKYSCYKNIATICSRLGIYQDAIDAYVQASELDDTDITLWYRLGKISLQHEKFELARYAFKRGVDCNPKHWPCIDNLITILLGLGNYHDCIENIYYALQLDPEYYRGKVYRKHIFTVHPYVQEYMALINPIYKWSPQDDALPCGEKYERLIREAFTIGNNYVECINRNRTVQHLPVLTLNKPIEKLTWLSLGRSLSDMHRYMSENKFSHACVVEIGMPVIKNPEEEPVVVENSEAKSPQEPAEEAVPEEPKVEKEEPNVDKVEDVKNACETEKEPQGDQDNAVQDANKSNGENKETKKVISRRRGSSLSFLEQWEWCTKRRSSRKKPSNKQDRSDETIYETLKRLLPESYMADESKRKKNKDSSGDDSMDTMDIYKLFEEKDGEGEAKDAPSDQQTSPESVYFGTEQEENDVEKFIMKYVESKRDIISMVEDYVLILSRHWKIKWPSDLGRVYVKCNRCVKQHSDPPIGCDNTDDRINNFLMTNLLHLEIEINRLFTSTEIQRESIESRELIDVLKYLCPKFEGTAAESVDSVLRYLWIRCHAFLYEEETEFALDCLYEMAYELNCLDGTGEIYSLFVANFEHKPNISKSIVVDLLKSLERNKRLSTVLNLYEMGKYEEILPILQESFKHCQTQASKQEWADMGLDWAVYLVTLIEILWAMENTEQCFTWAAVSLHEALKHFFQCSPGDSDYDKWTLTVVKILVAIEHILKKEGSSYLEILPEKGLAHLVQDLVQIIVHQLDDGNCGDDMPLKTVIPWILLHYILQREEDCGRIPKKEVEEDGSEKDDVPGSIMILFTGHNFLGRKGWCTINDGDLLYFTLNIVMPRFRSPALSVAIETIRQCMEQVVFCIFGHPSKKIKNRYLCDHNVTPHKLDWNLTQQIFDLYKPLEMPEFNSYRLASITNETEQLFQRMLALLPSTYDPQPYVSEVGLYIENKKDDLPEVGFTFPYKVCDIYYLLADFYFKNNETQKALKYYAYDIVICKQRFDSWAGVALARASLLETKLNSCETFKTEVEYLNRSAAVERCFKKALEIDSSHSMLWIEYGAFVYGVHSFCSRMLKQASESLSMENFEALEKRKNDMLNTAHKCFISAHKEYLNEYDSEDKTQQDERWLHYYMLGKISEKKGDAPGVYLEHYVKAGQYLLENNATYPSKINYNNPQNLSVEALEIHYRIHASILKYIEQHESKTIFMNVGKSFKDCLAQCASGPFSKKKQLKEMTNDKETNTEILTNGNGEEQQANDKTNPEIISVSPAIKRSLSTSNDEVVTKKSKLTQTFSTEKDHNDSAKTLESNGIEIKEFNRKDLVAGDMMETACEVVICSERDSSNGSENMADKSNHVVNPICNTGEQFKNNISRLNEVNQLIDKHPVIVEKESNRVKVIVSANFTNGNKHVNDHQVIDRSKTVISEVRRTSQESTTTNTVTSKDDSSSESSSDSSSDDSSSDTSSESSNDSNLENDAKKEMSQEDINEIISICLDNLEDCVSRFPQHYKALYRLTHYHFYYKKDRNVGRCKDLMLGSFTGRNNTRIQGLFCERKNSNFFSGIWRIPASEIDRPGSFASHMSRCVLITMEILKEVDDFKALLELSIQLQRTPEADKKYLRDTERSELAEQAFTLCTLSIKGTFSKLSAKYLSNACEKKQMEDFILDVYRSHQRINKVIPTKGQLFTSHLIDCYKLLTPSNGGETNLLECSIKYCQNLIVLRKQQAQTPVANVNNVIYTNTPNIMPNVSITPIKKLMKPTEPPVTVVKPTSSTVTLPTMDLKQSFVKNLCNQSYPHPMSYLPAMNPLLSALSYQISHLEKMGYDTTQGDFLQQFISSTLGTSFSHMPAPIPQQSNKPKQVDPKYSKYPPTLKRSTSVSSGIPKPKVQPVKNSTYVSTSFPAGLNVTPSNLNVNPPSKLNVTPSSLNVTPPSKLNVTPSSLNVTSSSKLNVPTSNLNVTPPSKLNVTPSSLNITPSSKLNVPMSNLNVTPPSKLNVAPSNLNVTPSYLNVLKPNLNVVKPNLNVVKPNLNLPPSKPYSDHIIKNNIATSSPSSSISHTLVNNISIKNHTTQIKPAQVSVLQMATSTGGVKPLPLASTSAVTISTKCPTPHQQLSPNKTLQEKLAEKQKQYPNTAVKGVVHSNVITSRSLPAAVFHGKLPPSLTITKSVGNKRPAPSPSEEYRPVENKFPRVIQETNKVPRYDHTVKLPKPKSFDVSEIIVLDDDDDD